MKSILPRTTCLYCRIGHHNLCADADAKRYAHAVVRCECHEINPSIHYASEGAAL